MDQMDARSSRMDSSFDENNDTHTVGSFLFCRDEFWDDNLTWYNSAPRFTNCFEKSIPFAPLIYLIITLPFYIPFTQAHARSYPRIRYTRLNVSQMVLAVLLSANSLADLLIQLITRRNPYMVDFISPAAIALTFALVVAYIQLCRRAGIWTSGVLFTFWIIAFVCDVFILASRGVKMVNQIYHQWGEQGYHQWSEQGYHQWSVQSLATLIIHFVLVIIQLILCSFADNPPGAKYQRQSIYKPIPETRSSFLSQITYWWFTELVVRCHKQKLALSDLWGLDRHHSCRAIAYRFLYAWQKHVHTVPVGPVSNDDRVRDPASVQLTTLPDRHQDGGEKAYQDGGEKAYQARGQLTFLRALANTGGFYFVLSVLFKVIFDIMQFLQPVLLKYLIEFTADVGQPLWRGVFYAVLMFFLAAIQSIVLHEYFLRCMTTGMKFRTAIVAAIYRKSLNLTSSSRKESTVGEIVNLMSVDAQRFFEIMTYVNMVWSAPFQISISLYLLWQILGPSVLAGVAIMLLLMAASAGMANFQKKLQARQMEHKDSRMKMMNETLNGIKVLKLYAWEQSFMDMILAVRARELYVMKLCAMFNVCTSFLWKMGSYLVSLVTFAVYVLSDDNNELNAEKAFVSLALFNLLRFPLIMLPMMITNLIQAHVSVQRIVKFLLLAELNPDNVSHNKSDDQITVDGGSFSWGKDEPDTLHNINLHVKKGHLVAVVGTVGSGKSSLISALLGEMFVTNGKVNVQGSVAYVAQQSWIQNATLRDNILFSSEMDLDRYCDVIDACALTADLDVLPAGDLTEIGEKGINLSGGQKARVSLARAVYSRADVYLLDDPLSAVDAHVGRHIFDHVIGPNGLLNQKTRILVTHGISILPKVDWVVVLGDGEVKEEGTLQSLLTHTGPCAEFIRNYLIDGQNPADDNQLDDTGDMLGILGDIAADDLITHVATLYKQSDPDMARSIENLSLSRAKITSAENLRQRSLDRCLSNEEKLSSKQSLANRIRSYSHSDDTTSLDVTRSLNSLAHSSPLRCVDENGPPLRCLDENGPPLRCLDEKAELNHTKVDENGDESGLHDRLLGRNKADQLVAKETTETGKVQIGVYITYLRSIRYPVAALILLLFIVVHALSTGANVWLSVWSNHVKDNVTTPTSDRDYYLGVYGAFGLAQAVATVLGGAIVNLATISAAGLLHKSLLNGVLRSSMAFFDTTPMGRVINRFSKDVDVLDNTVTQKIEHWFMSFLGLVSTIIIISYSTPTFIIAVLPMTIIYVLIQQFHVSTSRQLKRLESVTRSPIFSHFTETLTGISCIRAFDQTTRFLEQSNDKVDENNRCLYPGIIANRWLAVRLEFLGHVVVFVAAMLAVMGRANLSPGLVGLSISYALNITQTLNWLVRISCDMETDIVAVERIEEYSKLQPEAPWHIEGRPVPADWPQEGKVHFHKYSLRYREGLDLVLKQIDVQIGKGEKIGVVGRTGAGKSSLTLGLMRILEASSGSIHIDGVNIADVGLHDLRSRLTIIPQDPVLFSGTLRMNLDPFNERKDTDLWNALQHSHLKNFVSQLKEGLEHPISEGGENLSVGQRQLICLARALLRKTKILILDEATAAVDLETDDLIQATIRTEFSDCTIIIIAHRLNTIMDCDRILVLEGGEVKELASPSELLRDKDSIFYNLAKAAGVSE